MERREESKSRRECKEERETCAVIMECCVGVYLCLCGYEYLTPNRELPRFPTLITNEACRVAARLHVRSLASIRQDQMSDGE